MSWTRRQQAGVAAAVVSMLAGLMAASAFGLLTTMPPALAMAGAFAALAAGSSARILLAAIAGGVGLGSLVASIGVLLAGETYTPEDRAATGWALAETASLLLLTLLVVRAGQGRLAVAAAGLSGLAVPAWLLRFGLGPDTGAALGGFAAWALVALLVVAAGLYLRTLDGRRRRSVADAREAQRRELARDLHDFVAHDVSGMLAQAQAGQILAERDPAATVAAFRRIEQAGKEALASMDHAVRVLQDGDHDAVPRDVPRDVRTIADLPKVAARFSESGTTELSLDLDPSLCGPMSASALPREVDTIMYRIVVEALTNVRRHAPAASRVAVRICHSGTAHGVEVIVTDDGPLPPAIAVDRRGGLGLAGLAERVETLGGTLTAGPGDPIGWRVAAFLPVPVSGR